MSAAPTQEELDQLEQENEALRDKIANANSTRATREAEASRAIRGAELYAENVRLQAELAAATEASKVGAVKEGAAGPLAAVAEQVKQAEALAERPVGPVDTNAENPPKDTGAVAAVNEDKKDKDKDGGNS